MEGRCQCGLIRFTTPQAEPAVVFVCHCTQCRHQSSSAFGVTARFPDFDIRSPSPGAISIFTRPNSAGYTDGYFCSSCGSRLMHKKRTADGRASDRVSVKAGCLDGLTRDMLRRAVHIWTERAIVDVPDGVESYAQGPPDDRG